MSKWTEIIEDKNGKISSAKVAYLIVTAALTWLMIHMELKDNTDATIVATVAAMGAGVVGLGKWNDASVERASMYPPPAPIIAPGPTTVINTNPVTQQGETQ